MSVEGASFGMARAWRRACLASLALLCLAACDAGPAQQAQTLPAGTDPGKIRFFCTEESDRAAGLVGYPPNYVEERQRAADRAFAACMARHNIRP
jgi:hypothetical protein